MNQLDELLLRVRAEYGEHACVEYAGGRRYVVLSSEASRNRGERPKRVARLWGDRYRIVALD